MSLSEHGTYTYQYDEFYRLTSADNPTIPDEAYTYDALGNRLSSVATTGVWSYNTNNELTGFDAVIAGARSPINVGIKSPPN